jgi:hypothetical protein
MVCVAMIFKAFEYVSLNSHLFHNICLENIPFNLFIFGGVTKFPSTLVPFRIVSTGWVYERSSPILSILTIFHHYPSHLPLPWFGHWVFHTRKGCTLSCGKKGLKAQRVTLAGKIQSQNETFEMIHLGIPEKEIKELLVRKGDP